LLIAWVQLAATAAGKPIPLRVVDAWTTTLARAGVDVVLAAKTGDEACSTESDSAITGVAATMVAMPTAAAVAIFPVVAVVAVKVGLALDGVPSAEEVSACVATLAGVEVVAARAFVVGLRAAASSGVNAGSDALCAEAVAADASPLGATAAIDLSALSPPPDPPPQALSSAQAVIKLTRVVRRKVFEVLLVGCALFVMALDISLADLLEESFAAVVAASVKHSCRALKQEIRCSYCRQIAICL
jgi:2C-methyl-D-erythritol 2,4-cyclodiphosphate synthase